MAIDERFDSMSHWKKGGGFLMKKAKMAAANACFTSHVMMHSLFGLGLGILLVSLVPGLSSWLIGVALMIIALALDAMRK